MRTSRFVRYALVPLAVAAGVLMNGCGRREPANSTAEEVVPCHVQELRQNMLELAGDTCYNNVNTEDIWSNYLAAHPDVVIDQSNTNRYGMVVSVFIHHQTVAPPTG